MSWFYNLIIGIGGIIIGLLTFADEIASKSSLLGFLKSLIIKIPFFFLASAMIIWASIQKDNDNETNAEIERIRHKDELKSMDSDYKAEKKITDSINELKLQRIIDSSYAKSIKASNEALAKYNLRLVDSLHSVASTINSKTSIAQLEIDAVRDGKSPIYLSSEGENRKLNIRMISANATSYNIRLNIYIVKEPVDEKSILDYIIDPGGYIYLVPDRERTYSSLIKRNLLDYEKLLIIMLGKFSRDEKGKEMLEFKSAFDFNFKENKLLQFRPTINHLAFQQFLDFLKIPR